jgi:hypothetical protein
MAELKLQDKVKAAVEINGEVIINMDNSLVYENIGNEEAFFYIKSNDGKEVKIRFMKMQ